MTAQRQKQKQDTALDNTHTLSKSHKKMLITTALTVLLSFMVIAKNACNAELIILNDTTADMAIVNPEQQELQFLSPKPFTPTTTSTSHSTTSTIPTDEELVKLMSVMKIDEKIDKIVAQREKILQSIQNINLPKKTETPTGSVNNVDELSEIKEQTIRQMSAQIFAMMQSSVGGISESVVNATDKEKLNQAYINSAKQYYTANEVQALIAFYDTPMGQSILEKQPKVNETAFQSVMENAVPTAKKVGDMNQTADKMAEILPQVQSILSDVLAN